MVVISRFWGPAVGQLLGWLKIVVLVWCQVDDVDGVSVEKFGGLSGREWRSTKYFKYLRSKVKRFDWSSI